MRTELLIGKTIANVKKINHLVKPNQHSFDM